MGVFYLYVALDVISLITYFADSSAKTVKGALIGDLDGTRTHDLQCDRLVF